jgi:hypothetical protein
MADADVVESSSDDRDTVETHFVNIISDIVTEHGPNSELSAKVKRCIYCTTSCYEKVSGEMSFRQGGISSCPLHLFTKGADNCWARGPSRAYSRHVVSTLKLEFYLLQYNAV